MQNMKQIFRNYKPMIIYYLISIILLVGGLFIVINSSDPLENHQYYRQLLDSVMGGILGSIIIITVFYSGKIHDYKKDFLKTGGKLETSRNLLTRRYNYLKSLFKEYEEMTKTYNEFIKDVEECLNKSKGHEQLTENAFKGSKPWSNYLCITFLTAIIFGSFYYNSEQTVGNIFFQLLVLIIGTLGLILYWALNEKYIQSLHKLYKELLDMYVNNQDFIGKVEDLIPTSRND